MYSKDEAVDSYAGGVATAEGASVGSAACTVEGAAESIANLEGAAGSMVEIAGCPEAGSASCGL